MMSGLQVVSQPNNVPTGPLQVDPTVATPAIDPSVPLQVQAAPQGVQQQLGPVQSAPAAPQPQAIPVQSAPQNVQPSVSVQVPTAVQSISTALARGASPQAILQAYAQQNPDKVPAIQEAINRGASPQAILLQTIQQAAPDFGTDWIGANKPDNQGKSTLENLGIGVLKGLGQVGQTGAKVLGGLADSAADTIGNTLGLYSGAANVPQANLDLTPHGVAQNVGGVAEQLGEFALAPEAGPEEVAADAAEDAPFLAKAGGYLGKLAGQGALNVADQALHGNDKVGENFAIGSLAPIPFDVPSALTDWAGNVLSKSGDDILDPEINLGKKATNNFSNDEINQAKDWISSHLPTGTVADKQQAMEGVLEQFRSTRSATLNDSDITVPKNKLLAGLQAAKESFNDNLVNGKAYKRQIDDMIDAVTEHPNDAFDLKTLNENKIEANKDGYTTFSGELAKPVKAAAGGVYQKLIEDAMNEAGVGVKVPQDMADEFFNGSTEVPIHDYNAEYGKALKTDNILSAAIQPKGSFTSKLASKLGTRIVGGIIGAHFGVPGAILGEELGAKVGDSIESDAGQETLGKALKKTGKAAKGVASVIRKGGTLGTVIADRAANQSQVQQLPQ